jgi:hypothetical protein
MGAELSAARGAAEAAAAQAEEAATLPGGRNASIQELLCVSLALY